MRYATTEKLTDCERLLAARGPTALSEAQLTAILLAQTEAAAARWLDRAGGLSALMRPSADASPGQLRRACRVEAALELGRRALDLPLALGCRIDSALDVFSRLRCLGSSEQEQLHVLGLDSQNRLLVHHVAAIGSTDQVVVSPRDIFRPLLRAGARRAVIAHNHPSGALEPSEADMALTRDMVRIGHLLDLPLLDHVVVTRRGHYSFAKANKLGHPIRVV